MLIFDRGTKNFFQGLNSADQINFWKFYVPFGWVKRANPCMFINMALRESKFNREISKDVDRTLPDNGFFQKEKGYVTVQAY